jgi:AcrR family transcriptional regulator
VQRGEQLLSTATALFLEHGYSGVSVDEIVKQCGGSKTNVYRQFGDKEGLFVAVIEALCQEFLREFHALDLARSDLAEGLEQLGRALLQQLVQPRHIAFQRLVLAESGRFPRLAQSWFEAGPQTTQRAIARFLGTRLAGAGSELDTAARQFHDLLVSSPVLLATLGQPLQPQQLDTHLAQAVACFLHGRDSERGHS